MRSAWIFFPILGAVIWVISYGTIKRLFLSRSIMDVSMT